MIKLKNNLDEMQEQRLLKIERNGFWLAFWGLFVAVAIQMIITEENTLQSLAGEWILLISLAVYMVASCIKNGIWDRRLSPNPKTNVVVSLIAGIIGGIIIFVSFYVKDHKLANSIAMGVFILALVFSISFIAMSLLGKMYKKRVDKLEADGDSE